MITYPGLAGLSLHEIPDDLVPEEPRLGGACAPVPPERFTALRSTGPVLLGRRPDDSHLTEFRASVVAEASVLFGVPDGHTLTVAAARPADLCRLVSGETWATGLVVLGSGPGAAAWRAAASATSVRAADAAVPLAVVAREQPDWRSRLDAAAPGTWLAAELSGTADVLTGAGWDGLGRVDAAFLCPSGLLGVGAGLTVAVLSPRAFAASPGLTCALAAATEAVSTSDLVMFAHAVRSTAERDAERAAAERAARRALVADWAAARDWVVPPEVRADGELTVPLTTTLPSDAVAAMGAFLEAAHLAYGLTDAAAPRRLSIGLYDSLPAADIERLLGLLDFLVERMKRATDPDEESR